MRKKQWSWLGWAAIALLCVGYGPMAIEYTWGLFHPGAPGLWDHSFATIVDPAEALGPGSIHAEQATEYADNRITMLFHTTTGGLAVLIFAAQFSTRFRRNLRRHRILGRVAVGLTFVGMAGSAAYLLAVGPEHTFDGPAFYLQLWALAFGTTLGTALGLAAAVRRQIAMHQALMAYAFALLLTAPLLRVGYLLLGNLWPESTQLETNLAGAAFLGTWAPLGAILASRAMAGRDRRSPAVGPLPGRWLEITALVAVAIALPLVVQRYAATFDGLERVTATGLVGYLAGLAVVVANLAAARRARATVRAEEWRVHLLALATVVPFTLLLWSAYDLPFTRQEAYFGALLTGTALPISLGFLVVVWRRRTVKVARPLADERESARA